ncbi:MAG: hypothetical protein K0Q91_63 [Fibrobacteria bacterium]|jgi:hypothetical protein|nr:hypothetical protein [Fibrobacteria bacterium]
MKAPKTILSLPFAALALGVFGIGSAAAQDWENTISRLQPELAKAYVASVPSGFGANLNTGWYHKPPSPRKFGFNVEGGIVTMATLVGSGKKKLDMRVAFAFDTANARHIAAGADTTGMGSNADAIRDSLAMVLIREEQEVRFSGPTVLGSNRDTVRIYFSERKIFVPGFDTVTVKDDTLTVRGASGLLGNLPGLIGRLQAVPLFIPQLTLGTVMGTNVTLRWLPETQTLEELGTVKLFGIGVQHNPAVWFEQTLPIDFGFGFFNQKLEVGDLMVAKSWAVALNVSRTFGERFVGVTPYGGVQYENTQIDFTYTYRDMNAQSHPVKFSLEGENKVRGTVGVNVRVLAINLNLDVAVSKYPTGSFGMMVGI